jgi:hypothetical protein
MLGVGPRSEHVEGELLHGFLAFVVGRYLCVKLHAGAG